MDAPYVFQVILDNVTLDQCRRETTKEKYKQCIPAVLGGNYTTMAVKMSTISIIYVNVHITNIYSKFSANSTFRAYTISEVEVLLYEKTNRTQKNTSCGMS